MWHTQMWHTRVCNTHRCVTHTNIALTGSGHTQALQKAPGAPTPQPRRKGSPTGAMPELQSWAGSSGLGAARLWAGSSQPFRWVQEGEVKPEGCQASLVAPSSRKHKASSSTLTFVSHGAIGTAQAVSTEQRFSCFLVPSGAVLLPGSSRSVPQVRCHAAGHDTRPSPVCSPGLALGFPHPSHQLSPRALARA